MPLISVIIPCYNVEAYIDRCMETVVNQTIGVEQLEIILVNDASTDNTLNRIQEWEKRFPDNIIVVTYENNICQGGARNIGIKYASADYIGFVDADDWIEKDMYEVLYEPLKNQKYDVVRGKFVCEAFPGEADVNIAGQEDHIFTFDKAGEFYLYKVEDEQKGIAGEFGSICTAIFRKNIIIDNNIWFPEGLRYEDNYWDSILRLYIGSMYLLDKIIYHYFINIQSTVRLKNAKYHFDRFAIETSIIEEYIKRGAFSNYRDELEKTFMERFYFNTVHIIFTRFDYIPDVFVFMKQKILQYFPDYKKNPYYEKWDGIELLLLDLLEMDIERFTVNEWEEVKQIYLETLNENVSQ